MEVELEHPLGRSGFGKGSGFAESAGGAGRVTSGSERQGAVHVRLKAGVVDTRSRGQLVGRIAATRKLLARFLCVLSMWRPWPGANDSGILYGIRRPRRACRFPRSAPCACTFSLVAPGPSFWLPGPLLLFCLEQSFRHCTGTISGVKLNMRCICLSRVSKRRQGMLTCMEEATPRTLFPRPARPQAIGRQAGRRTEVVACLRCGRGVVTRDQRPNV